MDFNAHCLILSFETVKNPPVFDAGGAGNASEILGKQRAANAPGFFPRQRGDPDLANDTTMFCGSGRDFHERTKRSIRICPQIFGTSMGLRPETAGELFVQFRNGSIPQVQWGSGMDGLHRLASMLPCWMFFNTPIS